MLGTATTRPEGQSLSDSGRLEALKVAGLMDSPSEERFDRYTRILKLALRCDVALISLVNDNRQFFKSEIGLPEPFCVVRGTPLSHSFCQHVVTGGKALRIVNSRADDLVKDNLAIDDLGVVAYLGTPLTTDDGYTLGSLCAISTVVREWTDEDLEIVRLIAEGVIGEIRSSATARTLRENLEARARAESERDAILHSLVHDMRTPLAAIISSLDLLEHDLPLNPDEEHLMHGIRSMSTDLLEMMNGMLEANRLDANVRLDCSSLDVTSLLRRAFETAVPLALDVGQRVSVEYPSGNGSICGDESVLYRVLTNLLTNAIKFCPSGSHISLTAKVEGGMWAFHVIDDGPGVAESERENIFERHTRGSSWKNGIESYGLGLNFCKRAVEAHGGAISVQDAPGGGVDFCFRVPRECGS